MATQSMSHGDAVHACPAPDYRDADACAACFVEDARFEDTVGTPMPSGGAIGK